MIKGQCFCGKIKYEIIGNILKSGICHCRDCQRLTGGSAWPFVVIPFDALIIQGDVKEYTKIGESGKKVHMGFCSACGSTLFGRPEIWPHIRTISASSLEESNIFSPTMHVWVKDAQKWVIFEPNMPQFDRNPV